jgi:hypothetical protein
MKKNFSFLSAVSICIISVMMPSFIWAGTDSIPPVSKCWPVSLQISMNTARDNLVKRINDYNKRNNSFNSRCARQFKAGEEKEFSYCQSEANALNIESDAIDKVKDSFLLVFSNYEKQYTSSDPKVVNGCNEPSGLGKRIDSAITAVYGNAPEGVSDRVKKGFQAIKNNDWLVARAWFQDAWLRDKDNAGLKRLIDLCEYTISQKKNSVILHDKETAFKNLSSQEKNVLNIWIHRVREAAKMNVWADATGDLPAAALDKVRQYVYGLSEAERDKLFFPDDFMTELILYDMMK